MKKIKNLFSEMVLVQRNIPGLVTALFIVSIVTMNLLANKSVDTHLSWLAIDCGILFSWLTFLLMDMINKHYGPRAAMLISVLALIVNLFIALMLFLASLIPGLWGESFVEEGGALINTALNHTFGSAWYVLLGSSIAFLVSAFVNSEINWAVSTLSKRNGFGSFAARSYISTFIAQFADNLVFALIVSHHFFGWSLFQCFSCALTGAAAELLFEVIFSPIGYRVANNWKKRGVGQEYIDHIRAKGGRVSE